MANRIYNFRMCNLEGKQVIHVQVEEYTKGIIFSKKRVIDLGTYDTAEAAHAASHGYEKARKSN